MAADFWSIYSSEKLLQLQDKNKLNLDFGKEYSKWLSVHILGNLAYQDMIS